MMLLQVKRNLLPLTKLEKRNIIDPTDWSLTAAERQTMVGNAREQTSQWITHPHYFSFQSFKLIKLIIQILFACILFFFDYVIYVILALIAKHGRIDFQVTGKHKLEVQIGGNGTVATLLHELFTPYRDNEHTINSATSNIGEITVTLLFRHKKNNNIEPCQGRLTITVHYYFQLLMFRDFVLIPAPLYCHQTIRLH